MEATDVEGNVEWTAEYLQASHITHDELRVQFARGDTLPRLGNRDLREVDSGHP